MSNQNSILSSRTTAMALVLGSLMAIGAWTTLAHAQATTSPGCQLSVNPTTISPGQSATLSWTSNGVTTGSLDQGLGSVASASGGSMTVQPSISTTYMGTFGGAGGSVNCSATLTVSGTASSATSDTGTSTTGTGGSIVPSSGYYYGSNTTSDASASGTSSSTGSVTGYYYGSSSSNTGTSMGTGTGTSGTAGTAGATGTGSSGIGSGTGSISLATLTAYPAPGSTPAAMVLQASSDGTVLIRGTVQAVTPSMITISSWGGLWMIRSTAATTVIPAGSGSGDLSGIAVGDFVGINGSLARDQIYTIDATLIRDWTVSPYTGTSSGTSGSGTSGASTSSSGTDNGTGSTASSSGSSGDAVPGF